MKLTKTMARRKAMHTSSSTVMSRCKAIPDGNIYIRQLFRRIGHCHIIAPAMHANTAASSPDAHLLDTPHLPSPPEKETLTDQQVGKGNCSVASIPRIVGKGSEFKAPKRQAHHPGPGGSWYNIVLDTSRRHLPRISSTAFGPASITSQSKMEKEEERKGKNCVHCAILI
nr:hypothetical protein Iba_chr09cCG11900 [Ipomoea batatas]